MDVHFDWLFLFIPVISAVVGWGTNVVAIKMMFYPVRFVGLRPFLGWQGIVPANAVELSRKSTDIITSRLIDLRTLFKDFDPAEFTGGNLGESLDALTDRVIAELLTKHAPDTWEQAPDAVKDQIRAQIRADLGQVAVDILSDVSEDIESIIDLKQIVMDAAARDRRVIGDMFLKVGAEEFAFIRRSGAYFGFLFGIFQMGAWVTVPAWWVLPVLGFFVGYVTNFLAIKLIFEPAEPRKIGPLRVHGLFHKRQEEVAEGFSRMVARDVLNPDNIMAHMTSGEAGQRLFAIVERRAGDLFDRYSQNPMVAAMVPGLDWERARADLDQRMRAELVRKPDGFFYVFASRAIDIYDELLGKMVDLDARGFESIIRPPFQKDEWKLIVAGAALGCAAGVLQVAFLFGGHL